MANKNIKIILYISTWIIIWGSIASLIDFPFLKSGYYVEGSLGQYLTFTTTAIASIIAAKTIFKWIKL